VESVLGSGVYGPLNYFFVALAVAAFAVEAWAFIDAIIRPTAAFLAAASMMAGTFLGRLTKPIWLIILGVAFVLGLYSAAYGGVTGFLSVLAFVAAATYLAAVRPKVKEFRKGGGSNSGPYGPW
jgi:Protein of unknown function (DUF2516)